MAEETENEPVQEETEEESPETRSLSQEEINKLIEAARKQEKDKLYETITTLRDQVKDLTEDRRQEREERDRVAREAEEAAEKERLAKLSAEDRLAEQFKKFEDRLAREAAEREKLQSQLEQERELAELERYKNEVLSEAGDGLIRELVRGTSKEEINASVATAKAKYQEYFQSSVRTSEGNPGRTVKPELTGKMPGPADGDLEEQDLEEMKGLRGLNRPDMNTGSMKSREEILKANRGVSPDYEKNRSEMLDRVGSLYRKMNER